jgi:hypothetical protein
MDNSMLENNTVQTDYIQDKFTLDALFKRAYLYRNSKEFIRFINFINRFNHYSRYNTMLVYAQNRAVTFFGGEGYWRKKFNRTIKEDARPYVIMAPGGPVMMVYDIFETEGELSPKQLLEDGLGRRPFEVKGHFIPETMHNALERALNIGIQVKFRPLSYFNGGYITTIFSGKLEINLNENAPPAEQFGVLLHELAHLLLGHTGHKSLYMQNKPRPITLHDRKLSRAAEELEAETVAYLIINKLDLETRSAEYIAGYIKSDQVLLEVNYEIIIKTADKIEKLFIK